MSLRNACKGQVHDKFKLLCNELVNTKWSGNHLEDLGPFEDYFKNDNPKKAKPAQKIHNDGMVKSENRVLEKYFFKYTGKATKIVDILRCNFAFPDVESIYKGIYDTVKFFRDKNGIPRDVWENNENKTEAGPEGEEQKDAVWLKDRFVEPLPNGYRDAILQVRIPHLDTPYTWSKDDGPLGLDFDEELQLTKVENNAAELAGLKIGWKLSSINVSGVTYPSPSKAMIDEIQEAVPPRAPVQMCFRSPAIWCEIQFHINHALEYKNCQHRYYDVGRDFIALMPKGGDINRVIKNDYDLNKLKATAAAKNSIGGMTSRRMRRRLLNVEPLSHDARVQTRHLRRIAASDG